MTLLAACVRREFEIEKLNNGYAFFGTSLGSLNNKHAFFARFSRTSSWFSDNGHVFSERALGSPNNKHAFFGKIISYELLVSQDQASTLQAPRLSSASGILYTV